MDHKAISDQNRTAWEAQSYQAWVNAYGTPSQTAKKLLRDPHVKLRRILPHIDNVQDKKVANPLGSHGRIAVALALLGADVTVFDISASNKQYATELATSAKVNIDYVLGDFIQLTDTHQAQFDCIVMELGVLHYFVDLNHFVQTLATIAKPQGQLILNEFHPLISKAIDISSNGASVVADYFSDEVVNARTPYEIFLSDQNIPECQIRKWTLGEIVTAFAQNGFRVNKLIEAPAKECAQLPGTFTLVATAQ